MKILDLFAGAGGFSLGFSLAGDKIIGGVEIDEWAADTFSYNHKESIMIKNDIMTISDDSFKESFQGNEPDIILGGPPCQGYSICRTNNCDPRDPRNSLFNEFLRIGKLFHPKILVMENVPNLINAKTETGESVLSIIKHELLKLNYYTYDSILEATDYGVPQIRKRLFIIASKIKLKKPFPSPTHFAVKPGQFLTLDLLQKCPTLWDAISDLPDIDSGEGSEIMEYDKNPINDYQINLRKNSTHVNNHVAMNHTKRTIERFSSMAWGESISDVSPHLLPYKRNGNGIISTKVYDQNNRRMHPNEPCNTIPASFYANFVHPYKHRNFTAREGARLQSFPDWFIFKGKPTTVSHSLLRRENRFNEVHLCQYNQIGNAVPPLMAKALALNLHNQIGN